jgi:hypothetical protein
MALNTQHPRSTMPNGGRAGALVGSAYAPRFQAGGTEYSHLRDGLSPAAHCCYEPEETAICYVCRPLGTRCEKIRMRLRWEKSAAWFRL